LRKIRHSDFVDVSNTDSQDCAIGPNAKPRLNNPFEEAQKILKILVVGGLKNYGIGPEGCRGSLIS
jgi:hypothetical protein